MSREELGRALPNMRTNDVYSLVTRALCQILYEDVWRFTT